MTHACISVRIVFVYANAFSLVQKNTHTDQQRCEITCFGGVNTSENNLIMGHNDRVIMGGLPRRRRDESCSEWTHRQQRVTMIDSSI